ncbi:unnamed protein product, partial [Callosobruchus maculatus]
MIQCCYGMCWNRLILKLRPMSQLEYSYIRMGIIINPTLSDHFGHLLELSCVSQRGTKTTFEYSKRELTENGMHYFKHLIAKTNWESLDSMTVNEAFNYFIDTVTWCLDISCPIKTITRTVSERDSAQQDKDWISEE